MVKVCLPGESGEILDQLGLDLSAIDGVDEAMKQMQNFDINELKTKISEGLQTVENEIKVKLYYSDYFDIDPTVYPDAFQFIRKMARPDVAFPGCNIVNDQWIPSLNQPVLKCEGTPAAHNATTTQCNDPGALSASDPDCHGCFDTARILYSDPGTMPAALAIRYACGDWGTYVNQIWSRYYQKKMNELDDVGDRFDLAMT